MYQILDIDLKHKPGLALDVTMDRTIRLVRFNLPENTPAIPFDSSASASYAPSQAELSQYIHDDGTEEIKVDFFATFKGSTTLKSTWINRRHPDRKNPFSDKTDNLRIIEDLPEDLWISLRRVIHGEYKLENETPEVEQLSRAESPVEAGIEELQETLDEIHIVRSGFAAGGTRHSKALYFPEIKISGDVLRGVYLVRKLMGGESCGYTIYDGTGEEVGLIFESVDDLGAEYLTGKPGILEQFEALSLVNRTGYKTRAGKVVRARGPLRILTGYGF